MFSILIPTFNNLEYLKLCISSLEKNSKYSHQIVPHVNIGDDGTLGYLKEKNIEYSYTKYNSGICEGINKASKLSKFDYILYAHDDFYFCPDWDEILFNEVKNIGHNNFYLSGTMMHAGQISFDCGDNASNFDEKKFLRNYKNFNYFDFQGSTWAPHLIHKDLWEKVGGLSEEYFPGTGSDPDLNMKLWKEGVRIFKGLNDFKVYHFGSIVTRKYKYHSSVTTESGSKGGKIFLLKWGISIKFFKKFYLQSNIKYERELTHPKYTIPFLLNYIVCKLTYIYLKFFYKKITTRKS